MRSAAACAAPAFAASCRRCHCVTAAQPLVIIAPAAPGGGWDQTARAMQRVLAEIEPGASVQVENVPGAAGTIGLARFIQSRARQSRRAARHRPGDGERRHRQRLGGVARRHHADRAADRRARSDRRARGEPLSHRSRDLLDAFKRDPRSVSWGGGSAGGTDDLLVRLMAEAVGLPRVERELRGVLGRRRGAGRGARRTGDGRRQWLRRVRAVRSPPANCACWRSRRPLARRRHRRADAARIGRGARPGELARGRRAARAISAAEQDALTDAHRRAGGQPDVARRRCSAPAGPTSPRRRRLPAVPARRTGARRRGAAAALGDERQPAPATALTSR